MKNVILILLLLTPFIGIGQEINIETINLNDNSRYLINSISATDKYKDIESAGKTLSFDGNGSFIVFKGITNCKTLKLSYLSSVTGDLKIIISYKRSDESNYSSLEEGVIPSVNKNTLPLNRFHPFQIPNLFYGAYDYKISLSLPQQSSGIFVIDNITFETYNQNEITTHNSSLEITRISEEASNKIYSETRRENYNTKVSTLKTSYSTRIELIRELSYRSNVLAAIAESIVLINNRAKLNDPNEYSIFKEKISFIRNNADEIQKVYIDTLINQIKYKQAPIISENIDKKRGLLRIAQVAGDIGNIITGGQFKSVVNSIQGMVSTIFSRSSVQDKIIEYTQNGNAGNPKPKFVGNKTITDVASIIQKGRETQAFLFDFFIRLEEEQRQFKSIIEDFKNYAFESDALIDEINRNQNDFYKIIGYTFTQNNLEVYYSIKNANADSPINTLLSTLKSIAEKHFDDLKIQQVPNAKVYDSKETELNNIILINAKMDELGIRYGAMASNLQLLFGKIGVDLKKPNPFGMKNSANQWIKNDAYGTSWEEYEASRIVAQTSFTNLEKHLKVVLSGISMDDK